MRILAARFRDGEEFLRNYLPTFETGGLFFPTRASIPIGQEVLVEVSFPDLPQKQVIRGQIAWQRAGRHRAKLRAGLGVEFLASEASRRDFLVVAARRELPTVVTRRHRRLPVDMPAEWRLPAGRGAHVTRIQDIGPGGAFLSLPRERGDAAEAGLSSPSSLSPGTDVLLELKPPGSVMPLGLSARIAWVRRGDVEPGFGVEFRRREGGGSRRLKELVRRIEEDIKAQEVDSDDDATADADDAPTEAGDDERDDAIARGGSQGAAD